MWSVSCLGGAPGPSRRGLGLGSRCGARRCREPTLRPTGDVGEFSQPINKAINTATVDDIAFAIQALGDEADALYRRVSALKQLHDRARRAGAVGAEIAVDAAARLVERRK